MTTAALTIILAFFGPLSGLSSEDYNTREASQAAFTRLSALTLPNDHENPEARRRILEIRLTHCPHVFPLLAERRLRLTDPAEWIEKHVVSGESLLGSKDDIFLMFHAEGNQQLGRAFVETYGQADFSSSGDLFGPTCAWDAERWHYRIKYHDNRSPGKHAIIGGLYWFDNPFIPVP